MSECEAELFSSTIAPFYLVDAFESAARFVMTALFSTTPSAYSSTIRRTFLFILVGALGIALLGWGPIATPAQAQEEGQDGEMPQPQRYENVTWNGVSLIDYKPGKKDRAMEIVSNYFIPAYKEVGIPVASAIELQTGPWDILLIGHMEDGPSMLTWETSPQEVRVQAAMLEIVDDQEEMQAIVDEYQSLIDRSTAHFGFSGRYGPPVNPDGTQ
ncbi:MAG: hypothetical protein GVY35_03330 [Bacteroidetes bacterium]|nr:hypothetical protein [Bacteroidota bacterium]